MLLLPSFPPLFGLLALAFLLGSSNALKCFTCDGICDCRDNQMPETCAPEAGCFTVKAKHTGQVLRKGCARECRAVSTVDWQKCHLCEDGDLCNDQQFRPGLFDDCAVEEFIGFGFGLPPKRRRPQPAGQQYRRSLSQYGEQGPVQNVPGTGGTYGYGQGPQQNSGYGNSGGGISSPQQNQLGINGFPLQQQSSSPSENSFLVRSAVSSPAQNADGSSSEEVSSPSLTNAESGGGGGQPLSARINAFLERMSPRSVPLGFGQGSPQQSQSPQFNAQFPSGPQQNAFGGFNTGGGNSPQQNSLPQQESRAPQASLDFGRGVRQNANAGTATSMNFYSLLAISTLIATALLMTQ